MRLPALIAATLALSLAAVCTPAAVPADIPPAAAGAAEAQRTWEAGRLANYVYDLDVSCFCIHRGQYAVEVRNGRIASVRNRASGAPAEEGAVQYLLTVDQLYDAIANAQREGKPTRVEYHPQLGYPTEAEIGLLADDSGTLYRIANLRAL